MDSRKLAEEILDRLFLNSQVLGEEKDEEMEEEEEEDDQEEMEDDDAEEGDEDEEEGEEDEDEDYGDDEEDSEEPEQQAPAAKPATQAPAEQPMGNGAASLSMKPSFAAASSAPAMSSGGMEGAAIVADAHGGTAKDALGKGDVLQTKQTPAQQPAPQLAAPGGYVGAMKEELSRDVRAMFEGAEDLSEEFVDKAVSLYEAAVISKVNRISEEINSQLTEQFENKLVEVADLLINQINHYMDYVVEEWMKENELAVENGIRTEIAENFISNLKNLFQESYIEVPAEKTDVFDELSEAIERLESRINEEMDTNTALIHEIKSLKAEKIFAEETTRLTALSAENVRSIAENLAFESEQDYRSKIRTLVEGYNKQEEKPATPRKKSKEEVLFESAVLDAEEPAEEEEVRLPSEIRAYYDAIERTLPR
jgi:hypothetical protein